MYIKLSEQVKDKDQLKTLSIEYKKTTKHLERLVTKGKRLLALMQICRKYETQDEKVIPFVDRIELKHPITPSSEISGLPDWNVARQVNYIYLNVYYVMIRHLNNRFRFLQLLDYGRFSRFDKFLAAIWFRANNDRRNAIGAK